MLHAAESRCKDSHTFGFLPRVRVDPGAIIPSLNIKASVS
jgi:hypothetical protein